MKHDAAKYRAFATYNDTWFCALVAVRYCMGRASYAPSLVQDWVKGFWSIIPHATRCMILRDVTEELERSERCNLLLGDKMDHEGWVMFRMWLKENIDKRAI